MMYDFNQIKMTSTRKVLVSTRYKYFYFLIQLVQVLLKSTKY